MRFASLATLLLVALSGCLSFSSSSPRAPESHTTIIVPARQ